MIAYKFLRDDGTTVFSNFRWVEGEWVEAEVDPCRSGIHACRVTDLPYWVGRTLHEIELDGEIVEERTKVIAARGRIVRRITLWEDEVRDAYAVLVEAQEAGVCAAVVGQTCAEVDAAARRVISDAGYGEFFVHRTGHGIGTEAHEDPYIVAGNAQPLEPGNAFSIEPGIYLPGRFGVRIEDICCIGPDGAVENLNHSTRELVVVE